MAYALLSGGGKDSTLALDRARRMGMDVRYLASIYQGDSGRIRFHGTRHELVAQQAQALGLELVEAATGPEEFEPVFMRVLADLRRRGCRGVILGNIHLADVHAWYQQRIFAAELEHVEPLWGEPAIEVLHEVVERGFQALIVSVDLAQHAVPFLGRELDADVITEIGITDDLDACGERGEYHTFVFDGPLFTQEVRFVRGELQEREGHQFLDLIPVAARAGIRS